MTETAHTARRPALVAGAIIGVVLAIVLAVLLAALGGVDLGTGGPIVVIVLFAGWALYCAFSYGPVTDADD